MRSYWFYDEEFKKYADPFIDFMDYREYFNDILYHKIRKKRLFRESLAYKAFVNFIKVYSLGKHFVKFYKTY